MVFITDFNEGDMIFECLSLQEQADRNYKIRKDILQPGACG